MTKKDIVRASPTNSAARETTPIVQKILDTIINFLATEGRVELRNFGVFEVQKRIHAKPGTRGRAKRSWWANTSRSSSSRGGR